MKKLISRHFEIINGLLAVRYRFLLIALVGMVTLPGFLEDTGYEGFASLIMNALVVYLGIYSIHETRKQLYWGFVSATVVIIINQFGIFKDFATIDFYLSFIIYILFYGFLIYHLLKLLIKTERVNMGMLYAAMNVYLLLGVIGGYLFMLIENAHPQSLNNLSLDDLTNPSEFIYFSFITLSTLGYGEISPNSQGTRSLSIILSTIGPMYLTILVALLVSRFDNKDE